ncbi:MAG: hypothetical protein Q8L54_14825 [Devosia sp.]|nr:hypothetical protein [Devosia sp.]
MRGTGGRFWHDHPGTGQARATSPVTWSERLPEITNKNQKYRGWIMAALAAGRIS